MATLKPAPTMTSYKTAPKQSYSLLVHRDGKVDIVYDQPRVSSHQETSANAPKASPRSTAATFGSSNTRIISSSGHRDSSASGSSSKHRDSSASANSSKHLAPESSPRHGHHRHSSESHRPVVTSGHHLSPPNPGEQHTRHRHVSMSGAERPTLPIPIPASSQPHPQAHRDSHSHSQSHSRSRSRSVSRSPQNSPQKQTRFAALPSTSPKVTASGHLAAPTAHYSTQAQESTTHRPLKHQSSNSALLAVPATASRHRPSTSAESFFFLSQPNRPKGWYNRRGDRFVQKGHVERVAAHFQWHPTFKDYPEPGEGWMDENGHFMPVGGGILKN
ncbi:hypothetical protein M408DRAFT_326072 [Serendipita vermifera MAFF 305830]|uniref:Uncharacterized protein n=1 Tax=Serendipita vermifera MAFF 305830 TaxID=933852 RepID=A0A0C3BPD8_SERVB|nr:hypothetical protein M408DRAFT_326072 [Serendipita vermifera MAFF 305830]